MTNLHMIELWAMQLHLIAKKNARYIMGFDRNRWEEAVKHIYSPGIKAKFQQNVDLMCTLINRTGYKKIVECSNDKLWGTGVSLNKLECLDQSKWTGQGILGDILEEIRLESRPLVHTLPPPGFAGTSSYHSNYTPSTGVTSELQSQQILHNATTWNFPCHGVSDCTRPAAEVLNQTAFAIVPANSDIITRPNNLQN